MGPGKSVHYEGVFTNQGCSLWEVSLYIVKVLGMYLSTFPQKGMYLYFRGGKYLYL